MNVKNEEDTILGSETRQSQASDGGALHPHGSSESQTDSLSGWAVAGAALAIGVDIAPLTGLREARLSWYVGLDVDGTGIGDRLWNGDALDEATARRVVALYRLTFRDRASVAAPPDAKPVYLILAMTPDRVLRMKPQNLVVGLPVCEVTH